MDVRVGTIKKAECQRIDAFELWCCRRLLRVPWTARRSNQSILKEISLEYFGRIDAEAETLILWPPDVKNWLTGKDPDPGKDWRQEEKETTEDEMVGWHHWLNGHEFGWTLGVGDGQGGLECCSPWCRKEYMTERLNNSHDGKHVEVSQKIKNAISSVLFSRSVVSDSSRPMDCSMPGFPVHHQLLTYSNSCASS